MIILTKWDFLNKEDDMKVTKTPIPLHMRVKCPTTISDYDECALAVSYLSMFSFCISNVCLYESAYIIRRINNMGFGYTSDMYNDNSPSLIAKSKVITPISCISFVFKYMKKRSYYI